MGGRLKVEESMRAMTGAEKGIHTLGLRNEADSTSQCNGNGEVKTVPLSGRLEAPAARVAGFAGCRGRGNRGLVCSAEWKALARRLRQKSRKYVRFWFKRAECQPCFDRVTPP